MDYKDLEEGEFRILLMGKIDALLEKHGTTEKRLEYHSAQLKTLWGMGGLSAFFAAGVNSGHK